MKIAFLLLAGGVLLAIVLSVGTAWRLSRSDRVAEVAVQRPFCRVAATVGRCCKPRKDELEQMVVDNSPVAQQLSVAEAPTQAVAESCK